MVNTGIYHPFLFVDKRSEIKKDCILKVSTFYCILTGDITTIQVIDINTGLVHNDYTVTTSTYDFNGTEIQSHLLFIEPGNSQYYVRIGNGITYKYSHCLIERATCGGVLYSSHSCNNQYYNWGDNEGTELFITLEMMGEITPIIKKDSSVIVTEQGSITNYTNFQQRQRVEFIAPTTYIRMLESITMNDTNKIHTQWGEKEIVNIEIESEEIGGTINARFTLSFVFKETLQENDACCIDINIDDIQNNENPDSGICEGFTAAIENTDDVLTVVLTNQPEGTISYRWYRDNVFISNAEFIEISSHGNYRVDVLISGCRASASYFKDNVCRLFQIQVTKTLNTINATASNIPDGETVLWSVEYEGVSVSSTLPYTALASGIYYVRATAGKCSQIKGVNVVLEDDDCDFTISITDNGNTLSAVTDANSPVYLWEFENGDGRISIGTGSEVSLSGKGIYWLSITNGGCEKNTYIYKEPSSENIIYTNAMANGTEFTILDIDLLSITNPAVELVFLVNNVPQIYSSATPTLPNTYTITNAGKVKIYGSITNGTIKMTKV